MRTLFVSGEVAPFIKGTELAELACALPARLHETGSYETRIMMPRYGTVSERKNRLHEVIRLSGAEIPLGEEKEVLKVKVASIPGQRLQVYFMDNNHLFKRKGIFTDKQGKLFPDNLERALFFGRGVLETTRSLGWSPAIVHAMGWISGLLPWLLRTEYAGDPLFQDAKIVYTPQEVDFEARFTEEHLSKLGLPEALLDKSPVDMGLAHADMVIYPPSLTPEGNAPRFEGEHEEMAEQAMTLYEQVLNGVPA
ncbi:MAG: glycogen synthase [Bacteroidetes bacterium]|nr:MAG: glycogen synthase [Bacteroidota bacterium]